MMKTKLCTKCEEEFLATTNYFHRKKDGKFGLHSWCKKCRKKYNESERGREANRRTREKYRQSEKGKKTEKEYHVSKRGKKTRKKYRESDKGKTVNKKYFQSEKGRVTQKKYNKSEKSKKTREKYHKSEKGKEVHRKHYEKNKLSCNMSTAIWESLKGNKAGRHWETLVPYTLEDLKQHLEKLFQPEMFWENYGKWHVDHKIPKSEFKFTNFEDREFQECWALENLQPLWAEENWKKNDKLGWKGENYGKGNIR